jgi:ribulose-phosphate 3-epimerase
VHLQRVLAQIREAGAQPGVALNPSTPPGVIEYVLDDLDLVLTMSVNPGFGGQLFIPTTYPKVRRLRELLAGRGIEVSVDGGVKISNAGDLAAAGAQILVAGSAIFEAADPVQAIRALRGASEVPN